MSEIVTRIAPSPTGYMHIGTARTALFNWLYARGRGGKFLLRIEDTDKARSTPEATEAIFKGMQWLGLDFDGDPVHQGQRAQRHAEVAHELLHAGKAYKCFATQEEIAAFRETARNEGHSTLFQSPWRDVDEKDHPDAPFVIRIKSPQSGETVINDQVQGNVTIRNDQLDDMILLRSDGTPVYMLAVVVDDFDMGITHVIRGDDHLSNTPRQCLLYDALNYPRPSFAHISMILGQDKTRLSKRHGATSALAYRDMGYLPSAMINYLARLGWSHGDQEIFSREDMIKLFSFDSVHTSAAVFDPDKLSWLNEHYIKNTPPEELALHLEPFLIHSGILEKGHGLDTFEIARVIPSLNQRAKTLVEMAEKSAFYFKKNLEFDEKAKARFLTSDSRPLLEKTIAGLSGLENFSAEEVEALFKQIVEDEGTKLGKLAQPVRVALTGTTVSPGIYDVILLLGKEETIKRLKQSLP